MILITTKRLINLRRNVVNNAMEAATIGKIVVRKVPIRQPIKMEELWTDKTAVIIFLRRYGCLFCRQWASEISRLMPILLANDIRLVGIGPEEIGLQDFVNGEFFDGELYVDSAKHTYKALGYRRFNFCTIIMSLFSRTAWDALAKGRADKIQHNSRGDLLQNGGLLIVKKGGQEVLLSYRQQNPADRVSNNEILKALAISPAAFPDGDRQRS